MNDQGVNSTLSFRGVGKANAVKLIYGDSASLFSHTIHKNLLPGKYTLVDLGGHKGEFLSDVLTLLPEYDFNAVIVDKVQGINLNVKAQKIVSDIIHNQLATKSIDVVLMRYVLPWDLYANQKLILEEIQRICRGFAIIQHQGARSDDPKPLQEAALELFSGAVPTLKRDNGFFTESRQIEEWMTEIGIKFEKIEQKYITTLSELFIEKYNLNETEAKTTRDILSDCDGIEITTWILRFNENK